MAFSDFKNLAQVQIKYYIKYQQAQFIETQELIPSDTFIKDLAFYQANIDIFTSEASRSEIIISQS